MFMDPVVQKKTRNLPNFTECHACRFRVDINDGKNRLQILYSEWRIVLLCKKCLASVESAQICSYCFVKSSEECLKCYKCKRSVHKVCFLNHKSSAPWSYSCMGSEFSICVDCWIPDSVETSRRVFRNSRIKKKPKFSLENRNSEVLDDHKNSKSLEDLVKDAKNDADKKIEMAARAREKAAKKALEARRAVELASDALNIVGKEDSSSDKINGKEGVNNLADDVELAFQLHRTINCSPRISNTNCLSNTSCMTVLKSLEPSNRFSTKITYSRRTRAALEPSNRFCPKITYSRRTRATLESSNRLSTKITYSRRPRAFRRSIVCKDSDLGENLDKNASELSATVNLLDRDSSTDANCLTINRKINMSTGAQDEECYVHPDAECQNRGATTKEEEGSCSNKLLNSCREGSCLEFDHRQESSAMNGEERFFFLKYQRKGVKPQV